MTESKTKRKEDTIKAVIHESIRFGAAIGSWFDSDKQWHCRAAHTCSRAIEEEAMQEILSRCKRIDESFCHACQQKIKDESDD